MIIRRLYYTSDTHHEMRSNSGSDNVEIFPIEEKEEGITIRNFLALCGDIGNPYEAKYENFISRHSSRFEKIFIISGNHEYYSGRNKQRPIGEIEEKIKEICSKFDNVHYLQKDTYKIDEVIFAGCTLWTPVNEGCESNMNDYRKIYIEEEDRAPMFQKRGNIGFGGRAKTKYIRPNRRQIRWYDILRKHEDMKDWINGIIENYDDKKGDEKDDNTGIKIIMLTHHAPCVDMIGENRASSEIFLPDSIGYAGKCEYLFKPPLICWISGHTHSCIKTFINDIPSISNCWGYPSQKTGINPEVFFEF